MSLNGKVAIITGATNGLGLALAIVLAKEGANVVTSARTKPANSEFYFISCDVSKEDQVKNLAEKTIKKFGKIDIWINNAGIWHSGPIDELELKDLQKLIEVNLYGAVFGSKQAFNVMKKQKQGVIVNVISTAGLDGKLSETAYCASKFAVSGFTKALRLEAIPNGIKVIAIYPGGMQTNFFQSKKPAKYAEFNDPTFVASQIVDNLKLENPSEEQVIKRK